MDRTEQHRRSLAKAISWRITGTLDTFILGLIVTRSMKFAGSIAVAELMTKIALFYIHERVWGRIRWGRR